jgi:hypothetical protein
MDKYIEILAYLFLDWQQIAIDNIRYSTVLAALAFFVGVLIAVLLMKSIITGLKRQLKEEKQLLKLAGNKCDELVKVQLHDAEQMADLQQKYDQIEKKLQHTETEFSDLQLKEQQLSKDLLTKKTENDDLDMALNNKTQLLEKLQSEFDEQKTKLSQSVLDKLKMEEIERHAKQVDQEANRIKQQIQQLEAELKDKNLQIEGFDNADQTAKINNDKIVALEAHIAQLKRDNIQIEEKYKKESKADYAMELENTVEQHKQQLRQFNKKLQLLIKQKTSDTQVDDLIDDNKEDEGIVGKVLNLFASLDKATTGESDLNELDKPSIETKDVWQIHHDIIEQLAQQLNAGEDDKGEPIITKKNPIHSAREIPKKIAEQSSELNSEETANLESFQQKLKGVYNKIIS